MFAKGCEFPLGGEVWGWVQGGGRFSRVGGGGVGTSKGTGKSMRKQALSKLPFSDLPFSFSPKINAGVAERAFRAK